MAIVSGVGGSVSGATYVSDVTQWEVTVAADAIDTTKMNATGSFRTAIGGIKSWSGSYTALVDASTVANIDDDLGSSVTAQFNLSSGSLSGDIVITDIAVSASVDSVVEAVFTFTGTGALTLAN